jgi:hypothetical protein
MGAKRRAAVLDRLPESNAWDMAETCDPNSTFDGISELTEIAFRFTGTSIAGTSVFAMDPPGLESPFTTGGRDGNACGGSNRVEREA